MGSGRAGNPIVRSRSRAFEHRLAHGTIWGRTSLSNVPMRSSMCSSKSKEASKKPGGSKPPELMWTTLVFLRGESPLSSPLARIWMQRRITQACFLTPAREERRVSIGVHAMVRGCTCAAGAMQAAVSLSPGP